MSFNDILGPVNLFLATIALANGLAGAFFWFLWRSLKKSVQKDLMAIIEQRHTDMTKQLTDNDKKMTETLSGQDKDLAVMVTKLDDMKIVQTQIHAGIEKTCVTVENLAKGFSDHVQESTRDRADLRARLETMMNNVRSIPRKRISLKRGKSR